MTMADAVNNAHLGAVAGTRRQTAGTATTKGADMNRPVMWSPPTSTTNVSPATRARQQRSGCWRGQLNTSSTSAVAMVGTVIGSTRSESSR